MDHIKFLEETAAKLDTEENRVKAYGASLGLGLIYENGSSAISPDLDKAFGFYEQAALLGSKIHSETLAAAYLGLCRVIRRACFNTKVDDRVSIEDMLNLKRDYANYITVTCDPQTVKELRCPEIAYFVGVICKDVALNSELHQSQEISHAQYHEKAAKYFHLGWGMTDIDGYDARPLCGKALADLKEQGYGKEFRPNFEVKLRSSEYGRT